MFLLGSKVIGDLKERYPSGTRVRLENMDDRQAPPVGTEGTVYSVDDIGTIHVKWDNGSFLGLVYGVDSFSVIRQGGENG